MNFDSYEMQKQNKNCKVYGNFSALACLLFTVMKSPDWSVKVDVILTNSAS